MEKSNINPTVESNTATLTKHRSPSYPSFSLRTAVAKTRVFYDSQKRNSVHVDIAAETLGYKIKSGTGSRAVAALINFGLMEETGSGENRKVKLTPLAIKILLLEEEDIERVEAIREAARGPHIYQDMLRFWPEGLPSNAAINKYLTFERNFNPDSVNILIRDFKDTCEYAQIAGEDVGIPPKTGNVRTLNDEQETSEEETGESEDSLFNMPPVTKVARPAFAIAQQETQTPARVLSIPITGGRTAFLNIPQDISENDFEFLQTYLRLMKDAIVTGHVSSNEDQ